MEGETKRGGGYMAGKDGSQRKWGGGGGGVRVKYRKWWGGGGRMVATKAGTEPDVQ